MKKSMKAILIAIFVIVMSIVPSNEVVYAEEYQYEDADNITLAVSVRKNIYTDKKTTIYTGKGVDRWIHISPDNTSSTFTIFMETYSGHIIYSQIFKANKVTHWFVGSDIRFVYLQGTPGSVYITDTEH